MIKYGANNFWSVLFSIRGTVFKAVFLRAVILAAIGCIFTFLRHGCKVNEKTCLPPHIDDRLSQFYTFAGLVMGLLLSFRINFAFNRWEGGVAALGAMNS